MITVSLYKAYTSNNYKNSKQACRGTKPSFGVANPVKPSLSFKEALSAALFSLSRTNFKEMEIPFVANSYWVKFDDLKLQIKKLDNGVGLYAAYKNFAKDGVVTKADGTIPVAVGTIDEVKLALSKEDFLEKVEKELIRVSDKVNEE